MTRTLVGVVTTVACSREMPGSGAIHEKGDVLGVVVLVAGEDIEEGAAVQFHTVGMRQVQSQR